MRLLIIQPWFDAPGHPAQSLRNTARCLDGREGITYLVSSKSGDAVLLPSSAPCETFRTRGTSIQEGTLRALFVLRRRFRTGGLARTVLFLDGHLVTLAALWPLLRRGIDVERLGIIYLKGPERILQSRIARALVLRFLSRPETCLFLRTSELVDAWRAAVPNHVGAQIREIQSLEIPPEAAAVRPPEGAAPVRFGIVGQLRPGKGIEEAVEAFRVDPTIGALSVAGPYADDDAQRVLGHLAGYPGFRVAWLSEDELLETVATQHYLLVLYRPWDARMESAALYLAARAVRPVVVFDDGWCGRMVRSYGCGIALRTDCADFTTALRSLPRPDSEGYAELLQGMARFRAAHAPPQSVRSFFDALGAGR